MIARPLNAGHDQAAADRARLDRGTIGYCPVCRRPASDGPTGPDEAMERVARHLAAEHDAIFAALLRIRLYAALAPAPDPYYPTGADW